MSASTNQGAKVRRLSCPGSKASLHRLFFKVSKLKRRMETNDLLSLGVKRKKKTKVLSFISANARCLLTLAVLAVLVARGDGVHAVAGGAVGGGAVGLGGGQAVHALDGVGALAAAGRDGVGALQAAVQGGNGKVVLGLGGYGAGVAQDTHHLGEGGGEGNGGC